MLLLKTSVATGLDTLAGMHQALQSAIKLEHSTIPPYLYALYSLKPGYNEEIRQLIHSIVSEEMLHMSLACNILNAIGGQPNIDSPGFIPTYPGPLPGTVEHGLIVPLKPFSLELLSSVFMVIEEPENPLHFPQQRLMSGEVPETRTIGQFYDAIKQALLAHGKDWFTGNPDLQVSSWGIPAVTDLTSALAAIDLIVEQGEGTKDSPLDPEDEPAHYYRFAEIYYGHQLRPNPNVQPDTPPNQKYIYDGPVIPFDPAGVWPALTNPRLQDYAPGSIPLYACQNFSYTYTGVLKALHKTFNGQPDYLRTAIGLMESLKAQAQIIMATPAALGVSANAGPTFEYLPVLPVQ
ncbi:ferritin-like protein [Hymenobacter sp. ASUV-10]|uniref:Ferritin-like protein n=1 Tax=Hymenobacter aranciens TaxID=3063996 RepID=A0ABT9B910_9BACT|nr:ferritin-like protein [Hymenobacter sp. ASUV-10]MDO7874759.1 ferritin-like protein [Hymenobacter sp. ASUV-10]